MTSIMTGFLEGSGGGVEGLVLETLGVLVGSADMLAPILSFSSSSSCQARNDSFVCRPIRSGSLQCTVYNITKISNIICMHVQ